MKRQNRNTQIEGLRGLSILIIVVYHIFDRYQQIYIGKEIKFMNFWGSLGVTIFFMISGYFAVKPHTEEITFIQGVRKFIKKVVRLYPSYLLSILIIFAVTHIIWLPDRTVNFSDFLSNVFLFNRYFAIPYVDGAHWYVHVLITMFLIITIFEVCQVHVYIWPYIVWILFEVVIDKVLNTGQIYPLGGPFIPVFCVGIALRFITEKQSVKSCKQGRLAVIIIAFAAIYVIRGAISLIECVFTIPVLLMCIHGKAKILEGRSVVFIGTISYPLYLMHQNISFLIQNCIIKIVGCYSLLCPFISLAIVFTIGVLMYYMFEQPVQRRLSHTVVLS